MCIAYNAVCILYNPLQAGGEKVKNQDKNVEDGRSG